MHVLHRPHDLRPAALAAVAAAVLAIVLTLGIATGLNDLGSTSAQTSAPNAHRLVRASAITSLKREPFARGPFASALAPMPLQPWLVKPHART